MQSCLTWAIIFISAVACLAQADPQPHGKAQTNESPLVKFERRFDHGMSTGEVTKLMAEFASLCEKQTEFNEDELESVSQAFYNLQYIDDSQIHQRIYAILSRSPKLVQVCESSLFNATAYPVHGSGYTRVSASDQIAYLDLLIRYRLEITPKHSLLGSYYAALSLAHAKSGNKEIAKETGIEALNRVSATLPAFDVDAITSTVKVASAFALIGELERAQEILAPYLDNMANKSVQDAIVDLSQARMQAQQFSESQELLCKAIESTLAHEPNDLQFATRLTKMLHETKADTANTERIADLRVKTIECFERRIDEQFQSEAIPVMSSIDRRLIRGYFVEGRRLAEWLAEQGNDDDSQAMLERLRNKQSQIFELLNKRVSFWLTNARDAYPAESNLHVLQFILSEVVDHLASSFWLANDLPAAERTARIDAIVQQAREVFAAFKPNRCDALKLLTEIPPHLNWLREVNANEEAKQLRALLIEAANTSTPDQKLILALLDIGKQLAIENLVEDAGEVYEVTVEIARKHSTEAGMGAVAICRLHAGMFHAAQSSHAKALAHLDAVRAFLSDTPELTPENRLAILARLAVAYSFCSSHTAESETMTTARELLNQASSLLSTLDDRSSRRMLEVRIELATGEFNLKNLSESKAQIDGILMELEQLPMPSSEELRNALELRAKISEEQGDSSSAAELRERIKLLDKNPSPKR